MAEIQDLKTLLGVADDRQAEQDKAAARKEKKQVDLDYLNKVNALVGPSLAIDIATKYSLDDILKMESAYNKFRFDDQPIAAKDKLERVIKFLDWEKIIGRLESMESYHETIALSFSTFEMIVNKMIATGNQHINNSFFFYRDELTGVTRELLRKYGVAPTVKLANTAHLGKEFPNNPIKALPGITTPELVDFLIAKDIAGKRVNEYGIVRGFDDVRTAMEVASITDKESDALRYIRHGFTSSEQVKSISIAALANLEELFDFKGNTDSWKYHEKNYGRLVARNIQGKPERVDEFIEIAEKGGKEYLVAFNGSVEQTKRFLTIAPQERPSPQSIIYARDVLKVTSFRNTVVLAREIDSPHLDIFKKEFKTKDEFLAFRQDYEGTLNEFMSKTGKDIDYFHYDEIKAFDGDLRYLADFSLFDADKIQKVQKIMNFNTYDRLKVTDKSQLIPTLIDEGYTREDIVSAFGSENEKDRTVDGYELKRNFSELKETGLPLSDIVKVSTTGVDAHYAARMLSVISFRANGIPYGILRSLKAHDVKPDDFRAFIDAVGASKYTPKKEEQLPGTAPVFDAIAMIKDYKTFYNQSKTPEPTV